MGVFNFLWGQTEAGGKDIHTKDSKLQEYKFHTIHDVGFENVDAILCPRGESRKTTRCVISVTNSVLEVLESRMIETIQKDYPFEDIPFSSDTTREIPDLAVDVDSHHKVTSKVRVSDSEYTTKILDDFDLAAEIHVIVDVIIDKVTFMYREVDGQLINGSQFIRYTTPEIVNVEDELLHCIHYDWPLE